MLTGAARRSAASCGSLLIAAVPSSPIESDGFPTSSWCGARREASVGWLQRSWGRPVLLCLLLGWFLGGQPRMRVSSRDCAYIHVLELSVQLSGPGSFLAFRSVIHLKPRTCFALRSQSGVLVA